MAGLASEFTGARGGQGADVRTWPSHGTSRDERIMQTNQTSETGPEQTRLQEDRAGRAPWKKWGPYLSERQWATVREDYSPNGDAWNYLTHDNAQYRAYRQDRDCTP
jgi:hypothetical protein